MGGLLANIDHHSECGSVRNFTGQSTRAILSLPNTGFITAIDVGIGGGVHSPNKVPDGERMALQLRAKVYKEPGVIADGPTLASPPQASGAYIGPFAALSVGHGSLAIFGGD
jgi:hypothetical protein